MPKRTKTIPVHCERFVTANRRTVERLLKALSQPKRLAILEMVRARELPAGEIARQFKTTRPAISQHLRVLTAAGFLTERRQGARRLYKLHTKAFQDIRSFFDAFWDDRLLELKYEAEREVRVRRKEDNRRRGRH